MTTTKEIEHVPDIVIRATNDKNKKEIFKKVTSSLQSDVIVPIDKVIERRDGTVAIRCTHSKQVARAKELLSGSLGSEFEVNKESLKNPKMLITGIESEQSLETIVADINERNFHDFESECLGTHSFKNEKSKLLNVVIELTPELYSCVRAKNCRVYVGHQRCRAYDDLNVRPCYKCGRYGHSGSKCEN